MRINLMLRFAGVFLWVALFLVGPASANASVKGTQTVTPKTEGADSAGEQRTFIFPGGKLALPAHWVSEKISTIQIPDTGKNLPSEIKVTRALRYSKENVVEASLTAMHINAKLTQDSMAVSPNSWKALAWVMHQSLNTASHSGSRIVILPPGVRVINGVEALTTTFSDTEPDRGNILCTMAIVICTDGNVILINVDRSAAAEPALEQELTGMLDTLSIPNALPISQYDPVNASPSSAYGHPAAQTPGKEAVDAAGRQRTLIFPGGKLTLPVQWVDKLTFPVPIPASESNPPGEARGSRATRYDERNAEQASLEIVHTEFPSWQASTANPEGRRKKLVQAMSQDTSLKTLFNSYLAESPPSLKIINGMEALAIKFSYVAPSTGKMTCTTMIFLCADDSLIQVTLRRPAAACSTVEQELTDILNTLQIPNTLPISQYF